MVHAQAGPIVGGITHCDDFGTKLGLPKFVLSSSATTPVLYSVNHITLCDGSIFTLVGFAIVIAGGKRVFSVSTTGAAAILQYRNTVPSTAGEDNVPRAC